MFTVKSGYRFLSQTCMPQSHGNRSTSWRTIWKMEVPTKIKFLVWRVCSNLLRPKKTPMEQKNNGGRYAQSAMMTMRITSMVLCIVRMFSSYGRIF